MKLFLVLLAGLVWLAQPAQAANVYPEDGLPDYSTRLYCRGGQVVVYALYTTTNIDDPSLILNSESLPSGMSCDELNRSEVYLFDSYGLRLTNGAHSRRVIFQEYHDRAGETWYRWEYGE